MANWTDVFISHSSKDATYAETLADFLSDCIDFGAGEVVCTSAVGYGLEFGSKFEKKLRKCIEAAEVVIPVVSEHSLASLFCVFEMGAAWGQGTPIKAVLAPGFDPKSLPRPLSSLHYFLWSDESAWIQLVDETALLTDGEVGVKPAKLALRAKRVAAYRAL
jgi:hypothetical protein